LQPRPPVIAPQIRSISESAVGGTQLLPGLSASQAQVWKPRMHKFTRHIDIRVSCYGLFVYAFRVEPFIFIMPSPTTFNITPAGIVYLLEGATLNYNLQSTYSLPVLVQVRSCIVPFLPQIADEIIAHVACLQSANGGTGQGTLEINLIEIDKKPVFAADMFNYSVSEGTSAGALLASSQPVSSSNPNTRNIPVYRLLSSNPPSSNFVLDPLSGQLSLSSVIVGGSLMFDATAIFALPEYVHSRNFCTGAWRGAVTFML